MTEENKVEDTQNVLEVRREKLKVIREKGIAFPNTFKREHLASDLHQQYDELDKESLEGKSVQVKVAGRIMLRRIMGKASFATIQDMSGRLQLYVKRDDLPEGLYADFKTWDMGDIVACEGTLFKTKTNELSVKVTSIQLLTKSLRPLPEKFHGLSDQEQRYRQRYLDLLVNEGVRETFKIRSKTLTALRDSLTERSFIEVETPMMQPIPGGATARPFATHHNALDMALYLRIAPELYLKRLVVGGFEKVFEINRNFRNEGVSTRHNPEFTMLELYEAYADYSDFMDLAENLLRDCCQHALGSLQLKYQGQDYDLSKPFKRISVLDSILEFNADISKEDLSSLEKATAIAKGLGIHIKDSYGLGKIQIEIFEKTVESKLMEPTFITEYPVEVSPLSRRNDENEFIVDRFELFIAGRELANGFSELNDPEDQAERFRQQVEEKEAGDDEAMHFDQDYITALEHGLPPTAGLGIGVDRLVMFLSNAPSIRDVILFPHMRDR